MREITEGDLWLARLRAREQRWMSRGKATVTHPRFGSVVVPCHSPLSAIDNAAEIWGCKAADLYDADVRAWNPGDGPEIIPAEFAFRRGGERRVHQERIGEALQAAALPGDH